MGGARPKRRKKMLRSGFNYNTDEASLESGLLCEDESKTQQHQKEEADINTIVKRFGLTGQLPENVRMPQYGDYTGVTDYQTALNAVMEAQDAFMQMPAHVRQRFDHDPAKFVEFCSDPKNLEEAKKLGLTKPEAPAVKTGETVKEQATPAPAPAASQA